MNLGEIFVVIIAIVIVVIVIAAILDSSGGSRTQTQRRPPPPPPPRHFRVTDTRGPVAGTAPSTTQTAPPEWGQRVDLPQHIPVHHNQKICVVCQSSIRRGFANTGWARCGRGQNGKLVHGHCKERYMAAHPGACPVCKTACGISTVWVAN